MYFQRWKLFNSINLNLFFSPNEGLWIIYFFSISFEKAPSVNQDPPISIKYYKTSAGATKKFPLFLKEIFGYFFFSWPTYYMVFIFCVCVYIDENLSMFKTWPIRCTTFLILGKSVIWAHTSVPHSGKKLKRIWKGEFAFCKWI